MLANLYICKNLILMSQGKSQKKVVVTTQKSIQPTKSTLGNLPKGQSESVLAFGRENYKLMILGVGLIAFGFLLMSGGQMPSPDVWDDSIIYSTRRTLIAPIVILTGLIVEIYAIFK